MKDKYTIYILFNKDTKRYFYIGVTTCPIIRCRAHVKTFGKNIEMEVLQVITTTRTNAYKIESYWINQFSASGVKIKNTNCHAFRRTNPCRSVR